MALRRSACFLPNERSILSILGRPGPLTMPLPMQAYSEAVCEASLLIPFKLEGADDEWDEVTEQLQAIEWGIGL